MAKITKKSSLNIKGIYHIDENNQIMIEVEDMDSPVDLAEISQEFNGHEITLSINQSDDLA